MKRLVFLLIMLPLVSFGQAGAVTSIWDDLVKDQLAPYYALAALTIIGVNALLVWNYNSHKRFIKRATQILGKDKTHPSINHH